jgi:hypothetical protein
LPPKRGFGREQRYGRIPLKASLILALVEASGGTEIRFSLAARSAFIRWKTILPRPAKTAARTTGKTIDLAFSAMPQS